jgi:hypothetical protein
MPPFVAPALWLGALVDCAPAAARGAAAVPAEDVAPVPCEALAVKAEAAAALCVARRAICAEEAVAAPETVAVVCAPDKL